ncbi:MULTISPECIES: spore coat U domain-containing protein [unclassified Duganella]|jgi:spore coat protein U-like protein|uniref:Csu type fimbrial protein n=1 Tax=unclassified Duganella TaxID=2636909 RepID=UPI00088032A5|nr:Spore coat protein U (SCPU) domain-containing protein [Duganella sp. OV458]SDI67024.1 Spore coat protein U (SCPU) domain-containing protein [Duganella sp. OV510]
MKRTIVTRVALAAALGAAMLPMLSGAASKTQTFDVTLKIIADCVIATNPLDFGQSQGVLATAVSVNTTLNITCTNTTPYNIGLNAGTGTGSSTSARVMSGTGGNTSTVAFNLYQASGTTNWGNIQGTDTKSSTGTGASQIHTVYGVVPVQTTPQPDTYKSTITATVSF